MSMDLPSGEAPRKLGDMFMNMLPDPSDPAGGHSGMGAGRAAALLGAGSVSTGSMSL